jgi:peptidoglycan/LPS O-acetylase OafA/YrhL
LSRETESQLHEYLDLKSAMIAVREKEGVGNTGRIISLESLRGVAALIVAVFHCGPANWENGQMLAAASACGQNTLASLGYLFTAVFNGHAAVVFFFVLSGFVLARSTNETRLFDVHWAIRFFVRRILRIFPAVIVCVLVFAAVTTGVALYETGTTSGAATLHNTILHMLLLKTDLNGALWTMQVEVLAIPLILISVLLLRQKHIKVVLLITLILVLSLFHKPLRFLFVGEYLPVEMMGCFMAGILADHFGKRWFMFCSPRHTDSSCLVFIALLFLAAPLTAWTYKWTLILQTVASAGIVGSFAFGKPGRASRLLEHPWLRFLGTISFSFYLYHPLSLMVLCKFTLTDERLQQINLLWFAVTLIAGTATILIVLPIGWLSWKFVEVPCMRWSYAICRPDTGSIHHSGENHPRFEGLLSCCKMPKK